MNMLYNTYEIAAKSHRHQLVGEAASGKHRHSLVIDIQNGDFMNEQSEKLLRHVVLLQFKDEVSKEKFGEIGQAFRALPTQIAAIVRLEWRNVITQGAPYSSCLIVTCRNEADLKAYVNHPAHQAIAVTFGSVMKTLAVIDYCINA